MNIRVLTCGLLLLAASSTAQAFQPYAGFGTFFPGYGYNIYGMDSVPYFALHPPVYYSRPVPRPYGWSPFAYPPGIMTPDVESPAIQPQVYSNPHVDSNASADDDRVAAIPSTVQPVVIVNPYVAQVRGDVQLSQAGQK